MLIIGQSYNRAVEDLICVVTRYYYPLCMVLADRVTTYNTDAQRIQLQQRCRLLSSFVCALCLMKIELCVALSEPSLDLKTCLGRFRRLRF